MAPGHAAGSDATGSVQMVTPNSPKQELATHFPAEIAELLQDSNAFTCQRMQPPLWDVLLSVWPQSKQTALKNKGL